VSTAWENRKIAKFTTEGKGSRIRARGGQGKEGERKPGGFLTRGTVYESDHRGEREKGQRGGFRSTANERVLDLGAKERERRNFHT